MAITFNHNDQVYVKDGKMGVGTGSPNRELHVIGQIALDNAASSPSAGMLITADGTSNKIYSRTANNNSTPLAFEIISGASSSLYIKADGNVGIGTTNPGVKLDINGAVRATAGGASGLRVHSNSGITASNNYMNFFTSQNNGWSFNSNGTGVDSDQVVRIKIDGKVGIGTTNPSDKLDVSGQITQIGSGDYHWVTCTARFSEGGVTLSRSGSGYVGAYPYKNIESFTASVAFKTTDATHLGIGFRADDADADDNNYAVILRNNSPTGTEVRVQKRVDTTQTYPVSAVNVTTDCDDGEWHTLTVSFNGSHIIVYVDNTKYIDEAWTDTSFTDPGLVGLAIYDGTTVFSDFSVIETKALLTEIDDRYVNVTGDTMSGNLSFADPNGNTRLNIGNITGASPYAAKIWTGNYHLTLEASGSSQGQIRFNTGTTTATEKMRILENGNVGIGVTGPDSFLQVKSHTHYDYVHDLHQKIATFNPSSMSGAGSSAAVNIGNGSYGTSGTENLYLQFLNTHGNYSYPVGWRLKSYTDLDATGASSSFAIEQVRRGNSTSANDGTQPSIDTDFLINQAGNVGIGATDPAEKLHIGSGTVPAATLDGVLLTLGAGQYYQASDGTKTVFMGVDSSSYGIVGMLTNHDLGFRTNNTEQLRIKTDGTIQFKSYTAGYLKSDASGNITVDTSIIEDTLDSVTDRGSTTTNSISVGAITLTDDPASNNGTFVKVYEDTHKIMYTANLDFSFTSAGTYNFNLVFPNPGGYQYELTAVNSRNGLYRNFGTLRDSSYIYWESDEDFTHRAEGDVHLISSLNGGMKFSADTTYFLSDGVTDSAQTGTAAWSYAIVRYSIYIPYYVGDTTGSWKLHLTTYGDTGSSTPQFVLA